MPDKYRHRPAHRGRRRACRADRGDCAGRAAGIATALVGKRPARPDNRTTALLAGSVTALETLGVWDLCAAQAAPLKIMRIVDDTGRLWRAPEVKFEASEIDLDAFGYNIENRHLVAALEQRARALAQPAADRRRSARRRAGRTTQSRSRSRAAAHCKRAARRSAPTAAARCAATAAGIEVDERGYPQVALTVCLKHSRPHRDTSTEFHTPSGPVHSGAAAGQPFEPGLGARAGRADEIAALDDRDTCGRDRTRFTFDSRKIDVEPGRGLFPLSVATAQAFCRQAYRTRRRSRACHPADRRTGPQFRPARCRHHRRACSRCPSRRPRHRQRGRAGALRQNAPRRRRQPQPRYRFAQPHAADRLPARARHARH